jgi:uncharacterized membrane protein YqjE
MDKDIHITPKDPVPRAAPADDGRVAHMNRIETVHETAEPSLGELFKQLAQDSATLVRQEVALAKAEMRENMREMARAGVLMAAGGVALFMALFAFTAFLIVGLGVLLANFWLSALLVTLAYAVIGGALLMAGKNKMEENDLKPEQTIQTLREDKRWAQSEIEHVKQGLQS